MVFREFGGNSLKPTVGSLFAGIGGLDLGFERAGFKSVWQVEIDPYCTKVLAKNFPEAERYEDVRKVGRHNLRPVDIIVGGFPCQDISVAGKGIGIVPGSRSGLWSEMCRIISELRPKFVLVENVTALLRRGMGRVLGDLADIGYDAEWRIISALEGGGIHRRERVWIIAYPAKIGCDVCRHYREKRYLLSNENEPREKDKQGGQGRISGFYEKLDGCSCSDSREERIQGFLSEEIPRFETFSWSQDVRRIEDLRGRSDIPEPLFRGSRDGIPGWMDRVGALGNAVVPQIAEWIALKIFLELEAQ
jgi:DNA (cytosine-5)-methyltransferase 1